MEAVAAFQPRLPLISLQKVSNRSGSTPSAAAGSATARRGDQEAQVHGQAAEHVQLTEASPAGRSCTQPGHLQRVGHVGGQLLPRLPSKLEALDVQHEHEGQAMDAHVLGGICALPAHLAAEGLVAL